MFSAFKFIGALGLIFITAGVLSKNRRRQDILYIIGGLALLTYSIRIREPIFMALQSIFTIAAAYDLYKIPKTVKEA